MELRFVPATESDARTICRLRKTVWAETYRGIYPDDIIDRYDFDGHLQRDLARIRDPRNAVWLIADGQEPVGYFYVRTGEKIHIDSLYVLTPFRRCGAGRAAFRLARQLCAEHGIDSFTCCCNAHNAPALAFYRAMGGAEISRDVGHENRQEDQITFRFSAEP